MPEWRNWSNGVHPPNNSWKPENFWSAQRQQAVLLSTDTIKVQQARVGQLDASIDRLKWRVEQAERNLKSTILVAPFSGVVRSSSAEVGRAITVNDVVVSMYEEGKLEVRFTLSDDRYGRLQTSELGLVGRKVSVIWSVGGTDWKYPAVIDRIGAEITSNRGGVEVFASVGKASNAVTIRPGAFVEVHVPDKIFKQAIPIPDTAVYGTDKVYIAIDGKLVERKVTISAYQGETALVTSGLEPGDNVLVTRITEVSEGLNVQSEAEAVAAQAKRANNPNELEEPVARKGQPTTEEFAAIAKANGMTPQALAAMNQAERRKFIQAHRAASR